MANGCFDGMPDDQAKAILEALRKTARDQEGGSDSSANPSHTTYDNQSNIPPPEGATEDATSGSSSQTGQAPTGTIPGEGVSTSNTTGGAQSQPRSPADEILEDSQQQTAAAYPGDQTDQPRTKAELNKILKEQRKRRKDSLGEDANEFKNPSSPPAPPSLWAKFKREFTRWFVPGGLFNSKELNSIYQAHKAADDYSSFVTDDLLTISENFDAVLKMMDGVSKSTLSSFRDAIIEEYGDNMTADVYAYMTIAMGGGATNYTAAERKLAFQRLEPKTRTMLASMRSQIDQKTDELVGLVNAELLFLEKQIITSTGGLAERVDENGNIVTSEGEIISVEDVDAIQNIRTHDFVKATMRIHTKMSRILKSMEASVEDVDQGGRGTFIHRAYAYNANPQFKRDVHANKDNIQGDARTWFAQMYQIEMRKEGIDPTIEQIDIYVEQRITEVLNVMSQGSETDLHTTNSDSILRSEVFVFKDLPDVPPAVRKMLGEIKDPAVNYAVTLQQQHLLLTSIKYAHQMRASGLKYGILSEAGSVEQNTRIKDRGNSPAILMLSNYYTTPAIEEAIQEHFVVKQQKGPVGVIMGVASMVKMGKTVISPATAVRNWTTALWVLGVNAGFNVAGIRKSWEVIDSIITGQNASGYVQLLTSKGVIGDGIGHQGLLKLSQDMRVFDVATTQSYVGREDIPNVSDLRKSKLKNPREWYKAMVRFYQGADDFPKVILFEKNRTMLAKAYDTDINNQRVIDEAAWRVKNTVFTYSKVPKIIKEMRNVPFTAPFISFPAEVIRTSYNWAMILRRDMTSGNAVLQKDAATRLIGAMTTFAITAELIKVLASEFGDMTDELEELVQEMGGRFEKNQHMIGLFVHDNGDVEVLNMSRYNPYAVITDAIGIFFDPNYDDQDFFEKLFMSTFQLFEPFMQPDILAESVFKSIGSLAEGDTAGIFEDGATFLEAMGKGIAPTVLQQAFRIQQTYAGESFDYGLGLRDPTRETLKMFGASTQIMNFNKQLRFSGYDYTRTRDDLNRRVKAIVKNPNPSFLRQVAPQLYDTLNDMEYTNQVRWGKLGKDIAILRKRGWSNKRISTVLRTRGKGKGTGGSLTKEEIGRALRGLPAPRLKYPTDAVQTIINQVVNNSGKQAGKDLERKLLQVKKNLGY